MSSDAADVPEPPESPDDQLLPVAVDARRIVAAATMLWFVAFAISLALWTPLGRHHHHDVVWTCLAGGVLGVIGYLQMSRHRAMGRTV